MLWQTAFGSGNRVVKRSSSGPACAHSRGRCPRCGSEALRLPCRPAAPTTAGLASRAELELLPFHTALAGMHVVIVLLRFVTPMALAVVGDLLLHAPACPRLIGFHLQAPVGRSLWLHAGHGLHPPRA